MSSHSLDFYLVKVRTKDRNTQKPVRRKFRSLPGGVTLANFVNKAATKRSGKYYSIKNLRHSFKFEKIKTNGSFVSGVLRIGEYGLQNEIIDINTNAVSYVKQKTEIDPYPYFFTFCLPDDQSQGVLAVQRVGLGGIKGLLVAIVEAEFKKAFPKDQFVVNKIAPTTFMAEYLKYADLNELRVIKHEIPADIADSIGKNKKSVSYPGKLEIRIAPENSKLINRKGLIEIVKGNKSIDDIFDLDGDAVKVTATLNGKERVVNVTDPSSFKASVDITHQIKEAATGFPDISSLRMLTEQYIKDIASDGNIPL